MYSFHMKKLICVLLLVMALSAGCARGGSEVPPATPEPTETTVPVETVFDETEPQRTPAPDFTVYDDQGNPVKLSDFFGKPIVLNFWASWCGPCKREMPDFDEVYLDRGTEIQFLMINLTDGAYETVDTAKAFLEDMGYSFPVYFDTDGEAAGIYGVSSIPTTYMIAADGTLAAYAVGAIDMDVLLQGISMISGE